MPVHQVYWKWEEAFWKFGFEDGDGWNGTDLVRVAIEDKFPDLKVNCDDWGIHNYMIFDIFKEGEGSVWTKESPEIGYDSPREYLPQYLIEYLDEEFPA